MTDWECTDRGRYFTEERKGGRILVSGVGLVVLRGHGCSLIINGLDCVIGRRKGRMEGPTVVVAGVVEEEATWFGVSVLGALCLSANSLS